MRKHFLALFLLPLGPLVAVSCTGDLNDVDSCYALAQSYCERANACDPTYEPSEDGGPNCLSDLYQACSQGSQILPNISNVRSCLNAINATECGMPPGNACSSGIPPLPAALVHDGGVDGATDSATPPTDTAVSPDSTVDTGSEIDAGMPCVPGSLCPLGNAGANVTQLAASSSQVFWVSGTNIMTFEAGVPTTFAVRSNAIQNLIATPAGGVAWIENGAALAQSSSSGLATTVLSQPVVAIAVELSGYLYGITSAGNEVIAAQLSGSPGITSEVAQGSFLSIGGDAAGTFVAFAYADGEIQSASAGSSSSSVFASIPGAESIAVIGSADAILVLNQGDTAFYSVSGSSSASQLMSGISLIAASGATSAILDANTNEIAVTTFPAQTSMGVPVSGTATALAVGGSTVYWATSAGNIYSFSP